MNPKIKKVIKKNREFLSKEGSFLSEDEFKKNDYGMDHEIFSNLNKKIKNYPTYTDLIMYSKNYLNVDKINYLEIGASVLKNFMQINNYLDGDVLVAYDINPIVPKYRNSFNKLNDKEKEIYLMNSKNKLFYFQGSVLDLNDTNKFNNYFNQKFNIIFSDALHTPEGVMSEYENIISKKLDSEFILYFDDLDFPGLQEVAEEIFNDLSKKRKELFFTSFKIYGWVGQYEKMHTNGIISNINFFNAFRKDKIYLPSLSLVKGKSL